MKITVGIAEMKVSANPEDELITYALGSCLGICVYDPVTRAGGLFHVMLPEAQIDRAKALANPFMFLNTGLPIFLNACYRKGVEPRRAQLKVAGGASIAQIASKQDFFQIGRRNFVALRKLLWGEGLMMKSYSVGGSQSRTLSLKLNNGLVLVKSNGQVEQL